MYFLLKIGHLSKGTYEGMEKCNHEIQFLYWLIRRLFLFQDAAALAYQKEYTNQYNKTIKKYDYSKFTDPKTKRQFELQIHPGLKGLTSDDFEKVSSLDMY